MTHIDFIYMNVINKYDKFHKNTRAVVFFILFMVSIALVENKTSVAEMIITFKIHNSDHICRYRGITRPVQEERTLH